LGRISREVPRAEKKQAEREGVVNTPSRSHLPAVRAVSKVLQGRSKKPIKKPKGVAGCVKPA